MDTDILLSKVTFLFILVMLGYVAGKRLPLNTRTFSSLLIYVVAPIVIFTGMMEAPIKLSYAMLPIMFFCISCSLAFIAFLWGGRLWQDNTRNLFAFSSGTGNTGYFGLPIAMALFDAEGVAVVLFSLMGFMVFESTVGFYITARGNFTIQDSLRKISRLPLIYAFSTGLLLNLAGFHLPTNLAESLEAFKGAYTVLGMMIVGLGLAQVSRSHIDMKFIAVTSIVKYIFWPAAVIIAIIIDHFVFHSFNRTILYGILLMSMVPLAANNIAVAVELDAQPQKAAVAVLASTGMGIIIIPFYMSLVLAYF
ncbi:AEC family transporter [Zooshikella ganghwensis]|uniref:AEC family transporter n=1 Tax=Zooshikella ganghwensis TaxID=202772 RepID=UPI0003FA20E1|nr:AEC family transporter [Zooshikella ganghwensis]